MKTKPEKNAYEDVPSRKQTKKRQKILISDILLDYANNSTIHGLRYIAEKSLTTVEKLFWLVIFTGSVILCSLFIKNVYIKWRTSPVIITISERLVSIRKVPFPSVTICPHIKSKATVYNFDNEYRKFQNDTIDQENINKLSDISLLCGGIVTDIGMIESFNISGRDYTDESVIDNIDSVAPKIKENLIFCRWQNESGDICDKLFKTIYTAEGVCYNMNGLASEEMFRNTVQSNYKYSNRDEPTRGWTLKDGYTGTEDNPFPLQSSGNDVIPDLEVYLAINLKDFGYDSCNSQNTGFKIYIQHPADYPQSSVNYYTVFDGEVSSMAISTDVVDSAPSLEDYPIEIRQCYFQKDRYLRYFKIYTVSNCRAECQSNYTFEKCGCVGFYMPHNNSSQICSEKKLDCMASTLSTFAKRELQMKISKDSRECNCLPECKSVEYHAETLRTNIHYRRHFMKLALNLNLKNDSIEDYLSQYFVLLSKVEMHFKNRQFMAMRRSELFGLTDVVANIGGLLSLFLGFSFLSLMELFYFMTLRLGCSLKRDLKEEVKLNSLTIANNPAEPITVINISD